MLFFYIGVLHKIYFEKCLKITSLDLFQTPLILSLTAKIAQQVKGARTLSFEGLTSPCILYLPAGNHAEPLSQLRKSQMMGIPDAEGSYLPSIKR